MLTPKQQHLAECLVDVTLEEKDARFVQNILISNPELDEEQELKLVTLYDEQFGYGVEGDGI